MSPMLLGATLTFAMISTAVVHAQRERLPTREVGSPDRPLVFELRCGMLVAEPAPVDRRMVVFLDTTPHSMPVMTVECGAAERLRKARGAQAEPPSALRVPRVRPASHDR